MKKRISWKEFLALLLLWSSGIFAGWQLKTETFQTCVSSYGIHKECVFEKANLTDLMPADEWRPLNEN